MSTHVLVTCPQCGDTQVPITDITLAVCSADPSRTFYCFDCAGCACEIRKIASDKDVIKLVANGVTYRVWDVPAEALEQHDGPALTWDDCLDFDADAFVRSLGVTS